MRRRSKVAEDLLQHGGKITDLLEFLLRKRGERVRERFHPPLAPLLQEFS
jgi:hypothetical protein